jgi:hypothetical protein
MKIYCQGLVLPFFLLAVGLDKNINMNTYRLHDFTQGNNISNHVTTLEMSVPRKATVIFRKGGFTRSGGLTAINSQQLTLSLAGTQKNIPLYQVKSVNFKGDTWIEGEWRSSEIRAFPSSLPDVLIKSFKLQNPPKSAILDLKTGISPKRLSEINGKIFVLKNIDFETPKTMKILMNILAK